MLNDHVFHSLTRCTGVATLGAGLARGPFSWLNQGCWLAYAATVAITVVVITWELVLVPAAELRKADRVLALWGDDSGYEGGSGGSSGGDGAAAARGAAGGASGGSIGTELPPMLIKARGRSQEGETIVLAEAAARRTSAGM